jgi:hypothetical protein
MAFNAGAIIASLNLGMREWRQGLGEAKRDSKSLGTEWEKNQQLIRNASLAVVGFGAAAGYWLNRVIRDTARTGDEIQKMALRTGETTENLSALGFAAEQSGTSLDMLNNAFRYFQRQAGAAVDPASDLAQKWAEFGFRITDAEGRVKGATETLLDMAGIIGDIDDAAVQASVAAQVFGSRYGPRLLPLLKQGEAGIRELMEEAQALGIALSQEQSDMSAAYVDATNRMKRGMEGFKNTIAFTFMPSATALKDTFTDILKDINEWVELNPELARGIAWTASGLTAFAATAGAAWLAFKPIVAGLKWIKAHPVVLGTLAAVAVGTVWWQRTAEEREAYKDLKQAREDLWNDILGIDKDAAEETERTTDLMKQTLLSFVDWQNELARIIHPDLIGPSIVFQPLHNMDEILRDFEDETARMFYDFGELGERTFRRLGDAMHGPDMITGMRQLEEASETAFQRMRGHVGKFADTWRGAMDQLALDDSFYTMEAKLIGMMRNVRHDWAREIHGAMKDIEWSVTGLLDTITNLFDSMFRHLMNRLAELAAHEAELAAHEVADWMLRQTLGLAASVLDFVSGTGAAAGSRTVPDSDSLAKPAAGSRTVPDIDSLAKPAAGAAGKPAAGSDGITVNVHNHTGAAVEVVRRPSPDPSVYILDVVMRNMATNPDFRSAIRG